MIEIIPQQMKFLSKISFFEFKARVAAHFEAVDDQVRNVLWKKPNLQSLPFEEFRRIVTKQYQSSYLDNPSVSNLPASTEMPKKRKDVHGSWGNKLSEEQQNWYKKPKTDQASEETKTDVEPETDTQDTPEMRPVNEPARPPSEEPPQESTGNRFDWEGLTSNSTMDTADQPMQVARMGGVSTQTSAGQNGTGETPVDLNTRVERGIFTETRTAALPLTFFFSMNRLDRTSPVVFKLRLNCPFDILIDNTFVKQTDNSARVKGISTDIALRSDNSPNPIQYPPATFVCSTPKTATETSFGTVSDANCKPAWRDYYTRVWESYHTIETYYRISCQATPTDQNYETNIFIEEDSYTGSSVSQVIPTNQTYQHYLHWPRVGPNQLSARNQNGPLNQGRKVFEGTWKPGQVQRNTRNDEDIKAWYPTTGAPGAPNPTWVEQKVLLAFADAQAQLSNQQHINVRVDVVYKVQFKDLKREYRYPQAGDGNINALQVPGDILQTPRLP